MRGGILSYLRLVGLNALVIGALAIAACSTPATSGTPGTTGGQVAGQTPAMKPGAQMTPPRTPGAALTPGARPVPYTYTLNQRGQSITLVDPNTLAVVDQINLGFVPLSMALSPDGRYAWVTHAAMPPAGVTPGAPTPAGTPGAEMTPALTPEAAMTPVGTPAALTPGAPPVGTPSALTPGATPIGTPVGTPSATNMVTIVDLMARQRVADVATSAAPGNVVTSSDGRMVFVGARNADYVMVIDANRRTETQRITVGEQPEGMAWVETTMPIAPMTPGATPAAPTTPGATPLVLLTPAAMTPGATPPAMLTPGAAGAMQAVLLVALPRSGATSIIDPQRLAEVARVQVVTPSGAPILGPTTVFASARGERVFATGGQLAQLVVLDLTNRQARAIDLQGMIPLAGASNPRGNIVALVPRTANDVVMVDVDAGQIVATIPVGQNPQSVTFTPDGTRVFVANRGDNTLSVIDVSSRAVAQTVQVGDAPVEVAMPEMPAAAMPPGMTPSPALTPGMTPTPQTPGATPVGTPTATSTPAGA